MKKTIMVLLVMVANCTNKNNLKYYQGYIYLNKNAEPDVEVYEADNPSNKTKTNENGFFKIPMQQKYISNFLIIRNKNKIIDSIQIIRTSGGEKINYYFVEGRNDTVFIDMKLNRIIKQ
ncbi:MULTISPECIES: hypothetical protein [Flavobacterium]|uniref:Uncharacterized protein n=1 Tax=Flavobacterium columnare TaxID=996 RepID=A0AA94JNZ0_9FLAO|nr:MULTISPECIES: hypothetical protein [Flavobacterium]MCH4828946.1 hypothetical protein [Flavobacterium columnare]MCH4831708.1 hypothetical protein [Flavobacterium columnare]QYS90645.1 hypothetical protein JJC04_11610 [Flavobacterium covae]